MSDAAPPPSPAPAPIHATAEPSWAKPSIGIYSLTLFVFALVVSWMAKNDTAFNLMIGAVISNVTTVVGYYFGSSSGSAQKTALMGTGAYGAPTPPTASAPTPAAS